MPERGKEVKQEVGGKKESKAVVLEETGGRFTLTNQAPSHFLEGNRHKPWDSPATVRETALILKGRPTST